VPSDLDFSAWVGSSRTRRETLDPWAAGALAATLDRDPTSMTDGAVLPLGWHWIYFKDAVPASKLGPDGHEARGDFLPPVPLPRRMWAGGRIAFHAPLVLGESAERTSTVESVVAKRGRSGDLVFVTVRHRIVGPSGLAVDEAQDIVYRSPPPASGGAPAAGPRPPADAELVRAQRADSVTLFRFSALTFNGHRIHYDAPYVIGQEGYPGLVVHGPLLALLLLGVGVERRPSGVRTFEYRALSPLFCDEEFHLLAASPVASGEDTGLWAAHPERGLAMEARVR
jgi:3-methylfumaryl-CoA hydratase